MMMHHSSSNPALICIALGPAIDAEYDPHSTRKMKRMGDAKGDIHNLGTAEDKRCGRFCGGLGKRSPRLYLIHAEPSHYVLC